MDDTTLAHAERMIAELISDPGTFDRAGKANELLQDYFRGYPVGSLRPLLTHGNRVVRRTALFIAAELPQKVGALLDCIIPFLQDESVSERQHALETVFLCAKGDDLDKMFHVCAALEDPDAFIRRKTMSLLMNASAEQLQAAGRQCLGPARSLHAAGVTVLVHEPPLDTTLLEQLIRHEEPLYRRYGAVAAERNWETRPAAVEAAENSKDEDIREFAALLRQLHGAELESRRNRSSEPALPAAEAPAQSTLKTAELKVWLDALKEALVLIRDAARSGDAACAEDLADAFHNLPALLASSDRARLAQYGALFLGPLLSRRPGLAAHFAGLVSPGQQG